MKNTNNPSQNEQQEAYQKIAEALFKSIPNDWTECLLEINVHDLNTPEISITGYKKSPLKNIPDDDLYSAVYYLIDLFKNHLRIPMIPAI